MVHSRYLPFFPNKNGNTDYKLKHFDKARPGKTPFTKHEFLSLRSLIISARSRPDLGQISGLLSRLCLE